MSSLFFFWVKLQVTMTPHLWLCYDKGRQVFLQHWHSAMEMVWLCTTTIKLHCIWYMVFLIPAQQLHCQFWPFCTTLFYRTAWDMTGNGMREKWDDMQQRATGQSWTLGQCCEDTTSVHRAHTLPTQLLWRPCIVNFKVMTLTLFQHHYAEKQPHRTIHIVIDLNVV